MLQLIDQSKAYALVYRCTECHEVGSSVIARAHDGYFFAATDDGRGMWFKHVCNPDAVERARAVDAKQAKAVADALAKAAAPAVALPTVVPAATAPVIVDAPKRGRPKKADLTA